MVQRKLPLIIILFLCLGTSLVQAQDYFEPQTNITGYVSTEFNYFDNLDDFRTDYGTALSEAGLLITYRPSSNLTLKGVFVYRPEFNFDQMLNEAFGEFAFADELNVKVGRFLLPVSPVNTYYYAPVNTSATLPILITSHEFFPLNLDGISVNGSFGEDFKVKYDLFAGGYRNTTWLPTGAVGFFGVENLFFKEQINSPYSIDLSYNGSYNTAYGARASVGYQQYIEIGASFFNPRREDFPLDISIAENALFPGSPGIDQLSTTTFHRQTYGFSAKVQYENTRVLGELWKENNDIDAAVVMVGGNPMPLGSGGPVDLEGSFVELSHRIQKFTPYARYESQLTDDIEFTRWTFGLNYKPAFERTLKLEYMYYDHDVTNINGVVATYIYSF